MDSTLEDLRKKALRAAKRGDMQKADEIEFAYIKANVTLFSRIAERSVPAQCTRMMRGAGPAGETLLEWVLVGGGRALSNMDGELLDESEREACNLLISLSMASPLDLLSAA